MSAGNAAERWERCSDDGGLTYATALMEQAAALGVRLEALPGGRLWAVPVNMLPPALREALAEHRAAVVACLGQIASADAAGACAAQNGAAPVIDANGQSHVPRARANPATDWRTLPFGPERGAALLAARLEPMACRCCAGRDWWEPEGGRVVCRVCHPPPGFAGNRSNEGRRT